MEKTLVLIKPDAVERNLIGAIIAIYEENGLKVTRMQLMQAERHLAMEHYQEHIGKPYFEPLMSYITRSPLVSIELQGKGAIARVRALNGNTNPAEADANTIRGRFGLSFQENTVHGSDSPASAVRELAIWFRCYC
ncbi:MAG: nucleoside-diphosphate kinase [Saccharofermentanales bacterium]|jgi:nucleoside-diphosphate kinase